MISFFRKRNQESGAPSTAQVSKKGGKEKTILVVDDSPTEIHALKKILAREGYKVEVATDGQQGIESAHSLLPDLILMDVVMPVLNGFQATRKLSKDASTADIPVIIVTTKDQETDKSWAKRQGAVDYLVKPVNAAELVSKVRSALGD